MAFLLHIDTAVIGASVCLSEEAKVLAWKEKTAEEESAAWLHPAIEQLMQEAGVPLRSLNAIAVSAGPGSYTGVRIGVAAAKGLCFALNLPLIALNTLQVMALAACAGANQLVCPMIDARRMEVFTGLYRGDGREITASHAEVLHPESFSALLDEETILFTGNGSEKFQTLVQHQNAVFQTITLNATHMTNLAFEKFQIGSFVNIAYFQPYYSKEFYTNKQQ